MAITRQLQDEADRTIAGITKYYEQYGDLLLDAEEREHRIGKITVALEGCNGITDKEKLQKTAENLFGLTCAWERDSLALKREIMVSREKTEHEFSKLEGNMNDINKKIDSLCDGLANLSESMKTHLNKEKISNPLVLNKEKPQYTNVPWYFKLVNILDRHFTAASVSLIVIAFILVLSGNIEWLSKLFDK